MNQTAYVVLSIGDLKRLLKKARAKRKQANGNLIENNYAVVIENIGVKEDKYGSLQISSVDFTERNFV